MKNIKEFLITESKSQFLQFNDFVDNFLSSDCTIENGDIVIGFGDKKFLMDDGTKLSKEEIQEYEMFVKAYKDAGGTINEEFAHQGVREVFCNYNGKSEACKYILVAFLRSFYGPYIK